jgi:hypothetical protein
VRQTPWRLTKLDNELNVHLWFFTNKEYANAELRAWGKWWNAKQQRKIIDWAVFTEVQPHYTNEPELLDGLVDPLAGRRLGFVRRRRRTVKLYLPRAEEVAAELRTQQGRAIAQYNCATKPRKIRESKAQQLANNDEAEEQSVQEDADESDHESPRGEAKRQINR